MCWGCGAKPLIWRDFVPGYDLMKSTELPGDTTKWAIREFEDPTFRFNCDPMKDDQYRHPDGTQFSDEEINNAPESENLAFDVLIERIIELEGALNCHPCVGYEFVKSCYEAGYVNADGRFAIWLIDYMAHWIETHEPETTP